jgi:hypothetical protein
VVTRTWLECGRLAMKKYEKEFISLLKKEELDNIELYFSEP